MVLSSATPPLWEKQPPLDALRYQRFLEVGAFQAYAYLDGDAEWRQMQKEAFLCGASTQPTFDYPYIDTVKLIQWEQWLTALKKDIVAHETNDAVKRAYVWKIDEKLAEIKLLQATWAGDDMQFQKQTEYIYGKPSIEVFADDCQVLREMIARCQTPHTKKAGEHLAQRMPASDVFKHTRPLPHNVLVDHVRQNTISAMHKLFISPLEDTENTLYTAEHIKLAFVQALKALRITGRHVDIVTTSKSTISVNHEQKTILIPYERKLSSSKLQQLIIHEIGTHVLRRETGEASSLQLLGLWLDRYERGEEWIATMREQVMEEAYQDDVGLDKHLAVSLAYGLDGKVRWFAEVYAFLVDYYIVVYLLDDYLIQRATYLAQESAWSTTTRVFRGTQGTPWVCFTKDAMYKEGNRAIRNLLAKDAHALDHFPLGKYDPTNPRHIAILQELGILLP